MVILDFIHLNWTEKEADILFSDIEDTIENIISGRVNYQHLNKDFQYALIGNNLVQMFFYKAIDELRILYFHHTKQNLSKLDFLKK